MAVTAQKSVQVAALEANTFPLIGSYQYRGQVLAGAFDFTQSGAGDANSTADLCFLPHGRHRVFLVLSAMMWSAVTNGQVQIGHTGFTQHDGSVIAAAQAALVSPLSIVTAGQTMLGLSSPWFDYDAIKPVRVQALFSGSGGVSNGATLRGAFAMTPRGG